MTRAQRLEQREARGSPGWKAAGLSSSLGCHAAMQPTSITAWHWLSTRWSCAGLSAGNSARRDGQVIWARRQSAGRTAEVRSCVLRGAGAREGDGRKRPGKKERA